MVTGAASSIGLAASKRLAAIGMRVCLVDAAEGVMHAAASIGDNAAGFVVDVSDRQAVAGVAREIDAHFGPVSALMNNAGIHGGADAWL